MGRRPRPAELTDAMVCYLATGCGSLGCVNGFEPDLDIYLGVYAETLHGKLDVLRELWSRHAATLKRTYPERADHLFAELMLSGSDYLVAEAIANDW
jgi:hypothetical protein